MNSGNFTIGDIIRPVDKANRTEDKGLHPIVYIKGNDHETFIGAMITKSKLYDDNIAMSPNHFEEYKQNGEPCTTVYNDSYLVTARLMKFEEWRPFEQTGKLTEKGLDFVMSTIDQLPTETWGNYLDKMGRPRHPLIK